MQAASTWAQSPQGSGVRFGVVFGVVFGATLRGGTTRAAASAVFYLRRMRSTNAIAKLIAGLRAGACAVGTALRRLRSTS